MSLLIIKREKLRYGPSPKNKCKLLRIREELYIVLYQITPNATNIKLNL